MPVFEGLKRHEYLTTPELAARYGVSRQTIYNWFISGWLPGKKDPTFNIYYSRRVDIDILDKIGEQRWPNIGKERYPELVYKYRMQLEEIENA